MKKYILRQFDIYKDNIVTDGRGESQPRFDNGNYQGRRRNRRVQFNIWR